MDDLRRRIESNGRISEDSYKVGWAEKGRRPPAKDDMCASGDG